MSKFFVCSGEYELDIDSLYELIHDWIDLTHHDLTVECHELLLEIFAPCPNLYSAWRPDYLKACYLLIGQLRLLQMRKSEIQALEKYDLPRLLQSVQAYAVYVEKLPEVIVWGTDKKQVASLANHNWSILSELPHFRVMTTLLNMSKKSWRDGKRGQMT